ncbi:unnamed protein product [Orchesella dallaii]|uniref:XK-related protein n=1 Tax=Orchesella dallaii TaxID=48710 RepID=A0ABP1RZL6_9HEXA
MGTTMTSGIYSDSSLVNGSSMYRFTFAVPTVNTIHNMIPHVLNKSWDNLSVTLSNWQKSQLVDLEEAGARCLLYMWFVNQKDLEEVLPLFLVVGYAAVLETYHPVHCWRDYSERTEIWIMLGPMIFALLGIFVSILYCFVSKDVRAAIHRLYRRYTIRRTANSMRISTSRGSSVMYHSTIRSRPRIHFRTKLKRISQTRSEELSGGRISGSASPELVMVHEVRVGRGCGSGTSFPSSSFGNNDHESNGSSHNNPLFL